MRSLLNIISQQFSGIVGNSILKNRKNTDSTMDVLTSKRKIGENEETKALYYFQGQGWKLLKRNYQCRLGEIDLIFSNGKKSIVFIEVKYRSNPNYGTGQEAVGSQKQKRIIKSALFYIKQNCFQDYQYRFDVVAISPQGIEHVPNAFAVQGYTL